MKQYVLCYAESIDNPDIDQIVLIEKKSPRWQLGRLNLPGGKVDPNEPVIYTACLKLEEETGLISHPSQCRFIGKMFGDDWVVDVASCPFKGPFKVQCNSKEHPLAISLHEALCVGSRILPELRTVIPLCIARHFWRMFFNTDGGYTLTVEDVA